MYSRVLKSMSRVLALVMVASMPIALAAQDAAKPAAKASTEGSPSRWDIFAGYSYLAPKDTVNSVQPDGSTLPTQFKSDNYGVIMSGAYYFNKYVGAQIEGASHDTWIDGGSSNSGTTTASGGLIFRFPTGDITPFAHGLVGGVDSGGPQHQPYTWGVGLTAGGGLDYETPLLHHHIAIRLFQADYEYMHVNSGPSHFSGSEFVWGGRENIDAARLSAGVVLHVGSIVPPPPVTLACVANPALVFPGDPLTITATPGNLNPKKTPVYTWTGDGVTGNGTTATVATASLAPGTYTVKGSVKEGNKPGQSAECSATYTVKAFEPPTVSCSASPSTIKPGESSTITAAGVSPQNRPLTYAYSAAAGTVTGSGATATYASTGAPTGPVEVTCTVSDDKGQTASSNATVTISEPYKAPIPPISSPCSITFDKDKARPARVDNEAKACLDQVTQALKNDSTATAVVVGEATAKEKATPKGRHAKAKDLAAQRAVNTKAYLVTEEQSGIDPARISVRTGSTDGKTVENYIVPAGRTFDSEVQGTTPVDEGTVKPQARKALGARKHHKK